MTLPRLVLHDRFAFPGGGERVASVLARSFKAELWTAHVAPEAYPDGHEAVTSGPLHVLDAYRTAPFWARTSETLRLWRTFSTFPPTRARWTIFSGQLAPLAHHRIHGPKILYCHTPPRLLYDLKPHYLARTPLIKRPLFHAFCLCYHKAYSEAVRSMDVIAANSETVRKRIETHLGRTAEVVFPPCDTRRFRWITQEDFYLSTARVDTLKRVSLIVRAFQGLPDKKLVVVSGGPELEHVRRLASGAHNIRVLGWVDEAVLADLMGRCLATIYIPEEEDFGISPVESMAAGKPVIGVREGGVAETVVHEQTGLLLPPAPSVEDLQTGVMEMTAERASAMRASAEERAELFSKERFVHSIQNILATVRAE